MVRNTVRSFKQIQLTMFAWFLELPCLFVGCHVGCHVHMELASSLVGLGQIYVSKNVQ